MRLNSEPHLICIDIDGTLTIYPDILPEENISAIRQIREIGHKVFINTGRSFANLPSSILHADCFDGLICANGSYIRIGGNVLRNQTFPQDVLYEAACYFLHENARFCLFEGETHVLKSKEHSDLYGSPGTLLRSPEDFLTRYNGIGVNVISCEGQLPADFVRRFSDRVKIYQCDTFADCTTPGCSKADGMDYVSQALDIPLRNTVAIGDSANDLPMMQLSGFSVATANAAEYVRTSASMITDANTQAGVAKALRTLFLT